MKEETKARTSNYLIWVSFENNLICYLNHYSDFLYFSDLIVLLNAHFPPDLFWQISNSLPMYNTIQFRYLLNNIFYDKIF